MSRELLRKTLALFDEIWLLPKYCDKVGSLCQEIEAELAKPDSEPVAWASQNVIPLRGLKDNHPCIMTPFKCEANTVPLYAFPQDWKQLNDDEIKVVFDHASLSSGYESIDFSSISDDEFKLMVNTVRAVEKAHGIG